MKATQECIDKLSALAQESDGPDSTVQIVAVLNQFVRDSDQLKRTESVIQKLFTLLRLGFLNESSYVRSATCRALRYLLDCRATVDLALSYNLEWWILRSLSLYMHSNAAREGAAASRGALTKEKETQLERAETIRLVRCIALLSPTRFISGSLFGFFADFVSDYPQLGLGSPPNANATNANPNVPTSVLAGTSLSEQIEILRGSCALFCELAVLKPAAFTQRGGLSLLIRSLMHVTMNGDHKMIEALVLSCTHLLNDKASRSIVRKGIEVEQLVGPFTDESYLRWMIVGDSVPTGLTDTRGQAVASELSAHALLLVFRSWPSLFYCVAHRSTMIQPLVNVLYAQDVDRLRVRLLHFIYALFYLRRPAKRYFDEFLSGSHAGGMAGMRHGLKSFSRSRRFDGAGRFALSDGFLVEEATQCLHFRSNSRVNLLDSVLSVQLAAFVECGLLGAVACCSLAEDEYVAYLAAALGGDLLRLATRLVPHAVLKRHYSNGTLIRAALRRLDAADCKLSTKACQPHAAALDDTSTLADHDDDSLELETLLLTSVTASGPARLRQVRARETIAYLRSRELGRSPPLKAHCADCVHSLFFENVLAQAHSDTDAATTGVDEHEKPPAVLDARVGFFEELLRLAIPSGNYNDWNWRALLTLLRHLESVATETAARLGVARSDKTVGSAGVQKPGGQKSSVSAPKWPDPSALVFKPGDVCLQKCVTTAQYTQLLRLFRQLCAFYRPSALQFSKLEDYSVSSGAKGLSDEELARESLMRLMAECACCFFELLAAHAHSDAEMQSLFDDLMRDLHSALMRVADPNWQPPRTSESVNDSPAAKNDWRRDDEPVLSVANVQRSMSKYYLLVIGRMFRSPRAVAALVRHGIVDSLLELVGPQTHPVLVKLVISSLDYKNDTQARLVLAKALSCAQPDARIYATRFMRVLLRVNVPFFAHWAVALLCKQVYDTHASVRCEALNIIDEACETPIAVRTVLDSSLLHVHDRGFYATLVFNHMLAHPEGFQMLHRTHLPLMHNEPECSRALATTDPSDSATSYVDCELTRWKRYAAVQYAKLVEEKLYEALTSYEHVEPGECAHASANRRPPLRDVFVPPHLFGQLSRHLDGLRYLKEHRAVVDESCKRIRDFAFSRFCLRLSPTKHSSNNADVALQRSGHSEPRLAPSDSVPIRKPSAHVDVDAASRLSDSGFLQPTESNSRSVSFLQDAETDARPLAPLDCDQLKAALWNVAHLGSTKLGFQLLAEFDVLPLVVRICERCDLFSLRAVAYWSLCMTASTPDGAEYLARFGWFSVTAGRLSRYSDIVDEQPTADTINSVPSKQAVPEQGVTAQMRKTSAEKHANSNAHRRRSEHDALAVQRIDTNNSHKRRGEMASPGSRSSEPTSPLKRVSDFGITPIRRQFSDTESAEINSELISTRMSNAVFDVEFIAEADEDEDDADTSQALDSAAQSNMQQNGEAIPNDDADSNKQRLGITVKHRKCHSTDYRQSSIPHEPRVVRVDLSSVELSSLAKADADNKRVRPADDAIIPSRNKSHRAGIESGLSKSASDLLEFDEGDTTNEQGNHHSDSDAQSTASDGEPVSKEEETRHSGRLRPRTSSNRGKWRPSSPLPYGSDDESVLLRKARAIMPKESFSRQRRSVAIVMHYHRSVSTEINRSSALNSRLSNSASALTLFRLHQNADSMYRGICLPASLDDWLVERDAQPKQPRSSTIQSDTPADGNLRSQSTLDGSIEPARSTAASSASSSSALANDCVRLAVVQFGVQFDFAGSHEHAERCIACVTKRLHPTLAKDADGDGKSDPTQSAAPKMATVVRLIVALCNSITFKSSLGELRNVRERSPELFTNACFYSEVCYLLASMRNVRIIVRRVVHELFARLDRTLFMTAANELLNEPKKREGERFSDSTEVTRRSRTSETPLSRDDSASQRRVSIMTDPKAIDIVI